MRILCVFGQYNYGKPHRGEGYEYVNFIPALRRLGHEVVLFDSWNRACHKDFRSLNQALLQTTEAQQPDAILSVLMHYEVWLETWKILRDSGLTATVNWTTDDSWKYPQFSRFVAPAFHAFVTTCPQAYGQYARDGIDHVILSQWAANPDTLQAPLPARECQYSMTFVGTAHGKRPDWIRALRRRGIEVTCFGYGWPNGPVAAEEIPKIIRNSVISLNFANSAAVWDGIWIREKTQIKARNFEIPGAGGFLLTEWADGLDCYYEPDKEVAVFRTLDELAAKISHYLRHPDERDAMALAAYERTRREHTYDLRLAEVLEFALRSKEKYLSRIGHGRTKQIDWSEFHRAAQRHTGSRSMALLRRALVSGCSLVCGPDLGPRAARRLVFELSWRLAGSRTYSAAGLPGRMFYSAS